MVDGILTHPTAKSAISLIATNKRPSAFLLCQMPDCLKTPISVADPMPPPAEAPHAISVLKERGAHNISYVGIVGSTLGIETLQREHPDVDIFLAVVDEKLNDKGYIVPGLGDCGDRLFGTK